MRLPLEGPSCVFLQDEQKLSVITRCNCRHSPLSSSGTELFPLITTQFNIPPGWFIHRRYQAANTTFSNTLQPLGGEAIMKWINAVLEIQSSLFLGKLFFYYYYFLSQLYFQSKGELE